MSYQVVHPAVKFLYAFFTEMNAWEKEAAYSYESIDWDNITEEEYAQSRKNTRIKLENIYDRFCEIGLSAERLQDKGLSHSLNQPTYDPDQETIVEIIEYANEVIIETKQNHRLREKKKYHLVHSGDQWRVRDKVTSCSEKGTEWSTDIL